MRFQKNFLSTVVHISHLVSVPAKCCCGILFVPYRYTVSRIDISIVYFILKILLTYYKKNCCNDEEKL